MKWYSLLVMIFFTITIVSAGPYSSSINQGPYSSNINKVETLFDNNTAFVNETAHWVTPSLGTLSDINATQHTNNGGVLNIKESWLNSLYCKLTGCSMNGDIDMNSNDIIDVGIITADSFSGDGSGLTNLSAAGSDGEIQFNDGGSFGASSNLSWDEVNKTFKANGVILSTGTTGATPVSGSGTRLMWIPEKGAFRAGNVAGDTGSQASPVRPAKEDGA